MPIHKVLSGEWMGSIAADAGFREWRWIWAHGNNANLRSIRPDPNMLVPGDMVFVPTTEPKEVAKGTDSAHTFSVKHDSDKLIIKFNGVALYIQNFGPIPYSLTIGSDTQSGNVTGEDFQIEAPLPIAVKEATLVFGGVSSTLTIGGLHPIARLSGMQARLNNQGFLDGPVDNIDGPLTQQGATGFQEYYNLKVDGIIGPQTRTQMKSVYGC